MRDSFSIVLPFLIFMIIIALLGLVAASTILILDLRKMQREREKGPASVWYRRSKVRQGIEGMGTSLALLLFINVVAYSLVHHFSLLIVNMIPASIGMVAASMLLVVDFRKMQQEQREGRLSLWHRRPTILRHLGQLIFCLGFLLMMGEGTYEQAQGFPDSYFPGNLIFLSIVVLIGLLGAVLGFYAKRLQKQSSHTD